VDRLGRTLKPSNDSSLPGFFLEKSGFLFEFRFDFQNRVLAELAGNFKEF